MENQDAVDLMTHLAGKMENVPAIEDLVAAFAEFLAHIQPQLDEQDFAFLATVGAAIYRRGSRQYRSSLETGILMQRLQAVHPDAWAERNDAESAG